MKNDLIPYNPKLKELAKQLRNNSTLSEVLLWKKLRGKEILGFDFDRQKPIDEYIVDFYCKELKLAIEIDGNSHNDELAVKNDEKRQARLESLGVRFLRYSDLDIKENIGFVVNDIHDWILENR